jgi:hypothetical protein
VDTLVLGSTTGSSGVHTLSTGSLSAGIERIGPSGTGNFIQSGGTNTVSSSLILGSNPTGSGSYHLSNGNLSASAEVIGSSGTGAFTQTGGSNSAMSALWVGIAGNGSYTLSGGRLSVGYEYIGIHGGTGVFTQTGGTHTVANTLTIAANPEVTPDAIREDVFVVANTLTIAANPGSSGTYDLQGGTLTVNNGIVNNGSLHVGAGATATVGGAGLANNASGELTGSGTIQGDVVSAGLVAPGNSPGTLTINGDYTQSGILAIEIGGLLAGSEYDVLNVSGTASLGGSLNVSLFDLGSGLFTPNAGDSFDILTADLLQGSFGTLSFAALLDPNLKWHISYLTDAIGATDVVRLSVVNAVPVPPAVWLFSNGLLGLIGVARRRHPLRAVT